MLHFKVDLEGTFIQNLRAYQSIMKMCAMQKMSFEDAVRTAASRFHDFDRLQMLELRYEMHELFCVQRSCERNQTYNMNNVRGLMAQMLMSRQYEEFYSKIFFQVMGRGLRLPTNPMELIGKKINIRIKRDKE